jgi:PH and SEC7 domain-containing protein
VNSVRRTSHQDLSSKKANDHTSPRIGTVTLSPGSEENGNLDARGKELAARCHDENDDFLAKEKIAEWLGGL